MLRCLLAPSAPSLLVVLPTPIGLLLCDVVLVWWGLA